MAKASVKQARKIVKVYPYVDETGELLYEVVRYEPKDFRCRVPSGGGKFKWNMEGVRKVLYRLDRIVESEDETIFVCEGEKDVETCVRLGLEATCCQGSVNGWDVKFANVLKRFRVAIMAHNDDTGRAYAAKVAMSCDGVAKDWRVILLPGLAEHGDVTDYIDAGHDVKQLVSLVNAAFDADNPDAAPLFHLRNGKPKNGKPAAPLAATEWEFEVVKLSTIKPEPVVWLWEPFWQDCSLNMLVGPPGAGKTFTAVHLAASVSRGMAWPDGPGSAPLGDVVYLTTENNKAQVLVPRLIAAGADMERIHTWTKKSKVDRQGEIVEEEISLQDIEAMMSAIEKTPELRLIVVDPVTAYIGSVEPNDNKEIRRILNGITRVAEEKRVCIVLLSHLKKSVTNAINAIMGAQSFVAVVRSVCVQFKDPEYDENKLRLLVPVKTNESEDDSTGKRFRIVSAPGTEKRGCISWDAEPERRSADDIIGMLAAKSGNAGRETSSEDATMKRHTQFLTVLDKMTTAGEGWVPLGRVTDALGWNGSKVKAVVWELTHGETIEERWGDKPLPKGGFEPGGLKEIRRRRFDASL